MTVKTFKRSFAGGEIAPELYGRLDLAKFQTAVATARNFKTRPHGPAINRSGFEWVLEVKDSTKRTVLVPFIFGVNQTLMLEFGNLYMRVHTSGATVLEANKTITNITQANPGVVTSNAHGFVTGDWVFLNSIGGMTQLNGRFVKVVFVSANTFQIQDLAGVGINTTTYGAYTAGGVAARVFELVTPYVEADLFDLHYTQSADVMTITDQLYQQRELKRLGATNWTLTAFALSPTIAAPTNPVVAVGAGAGAVIYEYVTTAIATETSEESLASGRALSGSRSITAFTQANPGVGTTSVAHNLVADDPVFITGVVGMTQLNGNYYKVNTVPTGTTFSLKDELTGVPVDTTAFGAYVSGGTISFAGIKNDLTGAGAFNSITCALPGTAVRFNVYKKLNGLFGYIGQGAVGSTFKDNNITPDMGTTPPQQNDPFVGAGNFPAAVGYFQGKRWFGGTINKSQSLYATRPGTESNMSYSIPTQDGDSISVRLTSKQAATILHIVPLGDLLLLTSSGEWRVTTINSDAITPLTISYKPEDYIGASMVQPIVTSSAVLFIQARGSHVYEMKWSWEKNGYRPEDISLMAPHLFDGFTITSMTYAQVPDKAMWATRSDGVLLGLTYVPEQEVIAWHHHDTLGSFEAVMGVPEGTEDSVYVITNRFMQGRTVRSVERQRSRRFPTLADCFFVDCGLTYSGAPATVISGLWHLEGMSVAILADGAVLPQQVVVNGTITLDVAASKVHVGLPYVADLQTLPLTLEAETASGQGTNKNVNKVHLRVNESSQIFAGPSFGRLTLLKQRTTEPYGTPPNLISGEFSIVVPPAWSADGAICIRQTAPLPLTVLDMTLEVATGG